MLPQNENLRLCAVEELAHDNEVAIGELENDVTAIDEDLDEVKEDIEALNETVEDIPIVSAVTPAASAANLPGLKIGDTEYKIPAGGSSLKLHRIYMVTHNHAWNQLGYIQASFDVYDSKTTALNYSEIVSNLTGKHIPISGHYNYLATAGSCPLVFITTSGERLFSNGVKPNGETQAVYFPDAEDDYMDITDTII